jgi:hypothetical protein
MPFYLDVLLWLIFGSLGIALAGFGVLLVWQFGRIVRRTARLVWGRRDVVHPIVLPATGGFVISDLGAPALIWVSLFALIPLLLLAVWAATLEIAARRPGLGLVFAVVHPFLLWQLVRLGTHVQRRVDLSRTLLVVYPALGRRREVPWSAVVRAEDVSYVGPGVSGLYLYEALGPPVVLDNWLPGYADVRTAVLQLIPYARWSARIRGFLIG